MSGAPAFYAGAADAALADDLRAASTVQGLDGEIAILRAAIRRSVQSSDLDVGAVAKAIDLLVRALNARHRIESSRRDDLTPEESAILGDGFRYQGD